MKYIVDIHGEIEGDFEIIGKYEARPQGEWIRVSNIRCKCINCEFAFDDYGIPFNFCPNCGADMRGGAE